MIYGYFDESHGPKKEESHVLSFCGAIAHEDAWAELDIKWRKILDNPAWPNRPSRFHAAACVNAFEDFRGWGFTLRHAIFTDLMNLIIESDVLPCGIALLTYSLSQLPKWIRSQFGDMTLLMMQFAIQSTIQQSAIRYPGEEVGLVFDSLDVETTSRAQELHREYQTHPNWSRWTSFETASSYKVTMLQAADLLAYGAYRFHMEKGYHVGPNPDFRVIPIMNRLIAKTPTVGDVWGTDSLMDIWVRGKS